MDMQRRVTIVIAACLAGLLGSYLYAGILNPLKVEWLLQEGIYYNTFWVGIIIVTNPGTGQ